MAAQIRINDPGLIKDLGELGFTPETVKVLPLMPIVQLAWAEGGVSPEERKLLVSLARNRGISEGSPADLLLADWMARAPAPEIFSNAMRLIRAMLDAAPARRRHDYGRRHHALLRAHRRGVRGHLRNRQGVQ